mmetsp:Transcript_52507/g.135535  ORF Transcript_52507/g.135535 Transcript_52507/m.135535 type:complete len:220 (+) Transcript_52507:51-710(+)
MRASGASSRQSRARAASPLAAAALPAALAASFPAALLASAFPAAIAVAATAAEASLAASTAILRRGPAALPAVLVPRGGAFDALTRRRGRVPAEQGGDLVEERQRGRRRDVARLLAEGLEGALQRRAQLPHLLGRGWVRAELDPAVQQRDIGAAALAALAALARSLLGELERIPAGGRAHDGENRVQAAQQRSPDHAPRYGSWQRQAGELDTEPADLAA